jgi:hypothetical protein
VSRWLVAAWALAAAASGVVLWSDAHFVLRYDAAVLHQEVATTFRCFEMETVDSTRDVIPNTGPVINSYADMRGMFRNGDPGAEQGREALARLSRSGAALYVLAWAATALGLLGFLSPRGSPALRHVLLGLAAIAPLAALEYFHYAVASLSDAAVPIPRFNLAIMLEATRATWAARIAWAGLAGATAISWWRWPKRQVTPVDPEVFE